MLKEVEGLSYSCVCGKTYLILKCYNQHVKTCGSRVICDVCQKTFSGQSSLKLHAQIIHHKNKTERRNDNVVYAYMHTHTHTHTHTRARARAHTHTHTHTHAHAHTHTRFYIFVCGP